MIDYHHLIVLKTLLHRDNIKKMLEELTWHEIFVCSICIQLFVFWFSIHNKTIIELGFRMISRIIKASV